jgi:hypothetical protein
MDRLDRTRSSNVVLTTLCAALVGLMVLLIVADISFLPPRPVASARLDAQPIHASGWTTIGGLEAEGAQRWLAQSLPAPVNPVDLDQVVLDVAAASGSIDARLIVDVYESSSSHPQAAALRLSMGSAMLADVQPGLVHVPLHNAVHATPGSHWYTFVVRTSEPGAAATLGLLPGSFERPAMWSTSTSDPLAMVSGRITSWDAAPGSRLLLLLGTAPTS